MTAKKSVSKEIDGRVGLTHIENNPNLTFAEFTKIRVLDTNIPMADSYPYEGVGENVCIIVAGDVFEELDGVKSKHGSDSGSAYAARRAVTTMTRIRHDAKNGESFLSGIHLPNGSVVYSLFGGYDFDQLPAGFDRKPDNALLLIAFNLQKHNPQATVVLMTNDKNLANKANGVGVATEGYTPKDTTYTGMAMLTFKADVNPATLFDTRSTEIKLVTINRSALETINGVAAIDTLTMNQCCLISGPLWPKPIRAIYKGGESFSFISRKIWPNIPRQYNVPGGVLTDKQALIFGLVSDPEITTIVISGPAGSAKSSSVVVSFLQDLDRYSSYLLLRTGTQFAEKFGYLPGNFHEKTRRCLKPMYNVLREIVGAPYPASDSDWRDMERTKNHSKKPGSDNGYKGEVDPLIELMARYNIEVTVPDFEQGMTHHKTFMFMDDAQNIPPQLAYILATRIGSDSKIVFAGDSKSQIRENGNGMNGQTNGMAVLIRAMQGDPTFACITLDAEDVVRGKGAKAVVARMSRN